MSKSSVPNQDDSESYPYSGGRRDAPQDLQQFHWRDHLGNCLRRLLLFTLAQNVPCLVHLHRISPWGRDPEIVFQTGVTGDFD
ncbi:hypothetical protein GOB36_14425 [Sinorhizobium meliloti]|uniref:hypothetical protein n=1 Tax=Rhizobium meliloti TaxID=382 RepID=UPI00299E46D6|nr:hypothetical protein [Sinorhizobium meliloti]MDW9511222.1 hypothetical protein [Sinorhizobium meliloti]MDW9921727.1 hypothetical protein [Sinorhizobium meliloti]MDW9925965.1 hypothetical protein [Sinorhizobium meliloti]MDX0032873.1 hypothetical protein [Sinorhizobium meliloti]